MDYHADRRDVVRRRAVVHAESGIARVSWEVRERRGVSSPSFHLRLLLPENEDDFLLVNQGVATLKVPLIPGPGRQGIPIHIGAMKEAIGAWVRS